MTEIQPKETEMERAFLPSSLPSGLNLCNPNTITDIYLSSADDLMTKIRLRNNNGQKFQLTKKVVVDPSDVSVQDEHHIPLTAQEFAMFSALPGRVVIKDRYDVDIEGNAAEVDIFRGLLSGFVIIEFEFPNLQAKELFVPPEICATEVTQEDFIAGAYLAGKSYADISHDLTRLGYSQINHE